MKKLQLASATILLLILITLIKISINEKSNTKVVLNNKQVFSNFEVPYATNDLSSTKEIKILPVTKTLILEDSNTVSIKGTITSSSMAKVMTEIQSKLLTLEGETLYLFMDTGGGSIFAGLDLIDFLNSLPNNVVTVTKFAASMGFQIIQNMGTRYITPTGILMSHRARGGVEGQFDGELESQYKMVKEQIDRLEIIASSRMGITLEEYKSLIVNEFWSNGFRSVNNKSADEVVNVRCGSSLSGTVKETVETFFGPYEVEINRCPLIRGFISVTAKGKHDSETEKMIIQSYNNPEKFLREYILNNKFKNYVR